MSDIVARLDHCWNSTDPKARDAALEAAMAIRTLRSDLFAAHEQCRALRAEVDARVAQARRDGREEAARRVEMMWLRFREKDEGASDWIFQKYDDIPTGDDFVAAIRALGEKE